MHSSLEHRRSCPPIVLWSIYLFLLCTEFCPYLGTNLRFQHTPLNGTTLSCNKATHPSNQTNRISTPLKQTFKSTKLILTYTSVNLQAIISFTLFFLLRRWGEGSWLHYSQKIRNMRTHSNRQTCTVLLPWKVFLTELEIWPWQLSNPSINANYPNNSPRHQIFTSTHAIQYQNATPI